MVNTSTMRVGCRFSFDAGHFIPGHAGPCQAIHGHTYVLEVVVEGPVGENGMVLDFHALKEIVNTEVIAKLDHRLINDLIENPTVEAIIGWIASRLDGKLPLASLRLWEGEGKWAEQTFRSR